MRMNVKKGEKEYDPLFRVRTLASKLNDKFDSIPKSARLCVDEQMCSTKTKHHLRQYMPNKPHKWGVKLFVLCDSHGFAYRLEVYNGKGDHKKLDHEPDLGSTANVVIRLSQTIPNYKNFIRLNHVSAIISIFAITRNIIVGNNSSKHSNIQQNSHRK